MRQVKHNPGRFRFELANANYKQSVPIYLNDLLELRIQQCATQVNNYASG
jgi:hypothetical protein